MIFLDKQFYVSAFTKVLMNILDSQEMVKVQKYLLSLDLHPKYTFTDFDPACASGFSKFSSSLFPIPNKEINQQMQKLMKNSVGIVTVKKDEPNSSIKIFAYTIFALIFPTKKWINNQFKISINDSLLETLKCSIFSKDINFNEISNKQTIFDSLQAKAMIARFFNSLAKHNQLSNMDRIKYIQWSLQTNNILYELFIRFYRIILIKVGIEGAADYFENLPFEQTVNNLNQYFDIHYRCLKKCFLFSQENLLLSETKEYFILGEYFENQIKKIDQKKNPQIQSFADIKRASCPKKPGVVSNDVKLFNFMLDSGIHEKENEIQTPQFKDSTYQFGFGRKKKDEDQIQRQEQLKKQFQRLIMNSSTSSIPQNQQINFQEVDLYAMPTPFIGGQYAFAKIQKEIEDKIEPNQHSIKPNFLQSPIHELQEYNFDQPKINPQSSRCRNIVSVKDKHFTTFSPQATNTPKYGGFLNIANDALFIQQENTEYFKSSSGNIAGKTAPFLKEQCECRHIRKKRNLIVSKVIDFVNFPQQATKIPSSRSPKFISSLKFSENIGFRSPQIRVLPAKQKGEQNIVNNNKQVRKPTFLKFLKKGKQKSQKYSAQSHSISKSKSKSKSKNSSKKGDQSRFKLDKETLNKINSKIAKYSAIYNKQYHQSRSKQQSHSASRKNDSLSANKRMITQQGASMKKFDSKYINSRPGLGSNWKSSSNFHQPYRNQKEYLEYFESKKRETMKVYAPVNIIAPTLYFNGNYQKDNKVVFKVNDLVKDHRRDMQLKQSQKIQKEQFRNKQRSGEFYSNRHI